MHVNWDLLYLETVNYAFIVQNHREKKIAIEIADSYLKIIDGYSSFSDQKN